MADIFWNSAAMEPKRKYRFSIEFGTEANGMLKKYMCRQITKPSYSIGVQEHAIFDYNFRFPGRVTWDPINAVFVDSVDHNTTSHLYTLLGKFGYVVPSSSTDALGQTISKAKQISELGAQITLTELKASGGVLGKWNLKNPMITRATFGDLSYADETLVECAVDITYDWAVYTKL
jgi:hypothetical protein